MSRKTRRSGYAALFIIGISACSDPTFDSGEMAAEDPRSGTAGDSASSADPSEVGFDIETQPAGESERCELDSLLTPEVYTRRTKMLLTGEALNAEELAAVQNDPDALKELVAGWIETQAFQDKMLRFFSVALQQTSQVREAYTAQITQHDGGAFLPGSRFYRTMNESMARTALELINSDRPFNEIASTRTWMMTTELMAYLAAADITYQENFTLYHDPVTIGGVDYDANTPREVQVENRVFYSSTDFEGSGFCDQDPFEHRRNRQAFFALVYNGINNSILTCRGAATVDLSDPSDRTDWRMVTITRGEPANFWDSAAFRGETELPLKGSRAGFFSHPAFLATWRSNVDNSFRVTTNQSLIVGLGLAFEDTDISEPIGDDGLAEDHASPTTACYTCHKNLDPMRNYFALEFNPDTYGALEPDEVPDLVPSFSFQGHTGTGSDLTAYGKTIAEHPFFAAGWLQKMCFHANSKACNPSDPEFQRIETLFVESGFKFKTMLIELFSSPLVTGSECAPGNEGEILLPSVTRSEHFCSAIENRFQMENLCSFSAAASDLRAALPTDSWSRGADRPNQPTEPSLFYTATVEALCKRIGQYVVDRSGSPIQIADMEGSVDFLVEGLIGISKSDSRHAVVYEWLNGHVEDVTAAGFNRGSALTSATALACTSPFLVSTDF